jgi:alkylation response protein AidB-like acyl-CoA dehydrogenase
MDGTRTLQLTDLMDRIRSLAPIVDRHRSEFDRLRRLPQPVMDAMIEADLFRLWTPRALGGAEISPLEMVEVVEAAAALDGSFGWCLTNVNTMGRMVAYLSPHVARGWVDGPDCQMSGSTASLGMARRVAGGFRVTGRWSFTSGIMSARRVIGLCKIDEEGIATDPVLIFCHFAVSELQIIDTWFVSGLKGTGSHDFIVENLFVPEAHTHGFVDAEARHDGRLYRFPIVSMLTLSVSIVPLGIAMAAVQAFVALSGRTVAGTSSPLSARELIQTDLGRAEALRRSGKALIVSALRDLELALDVGGRPLIEARAFFRAALAHSAEASLRAVEILAAAAGTAAIAEGGQLERCLRDVQAAVKHVAMSPHNFATGGQVMLGLDMTGKRF